MNTFKSFTISSEEYVLLEKEFNQLCYFVSWQLMQNNSKNNHQHEIDDFKQDLLMAVLRAGSYYKRQTWIESVFLKLDQYVPKETIWEEINKSLQHLWSRKTHHGAYKRKFGEEQEEILEMMANKFVPVEEIPLKSLHVMINNKFKIYAKRIIWNASRFIGKKITKEKQIRVGQVSLSEHEFLFY
jgi:hypothetical protein